MTPMIFFITVLRALAACLITNAHYTGIYPTDLIANGGLIGDILFFAVSGYCLYNLKFSFPRWYGKRLWRIYLPVWIATAVFLIVGGYVFAAKPWYEWFFFPTYYHFVASILILYIPYYLFIKIAFFRERLPLVMASIAVVAILVYALFYDRSYYHIDNVREPFIRFLFMESMLLGAYFRQNDTRFRVQAKKGWLYGVLSLLLFFAYFASKLLFSKLAVLSNWQIVNQVCIFALLYCVFRAFTAADARLSRLPKAVKAVITFLADITLEIYVVQYVLIDWLRPWFGFPLNWLIITAAIMTAAYALHLVCKLIYRAVDAVAAKLKKAE